MRECPNPHHLFFLSSGHFGSFQLSSSGKRLLYIAEKDKPKPSSFFKKTSASGTLLTALIHLIEALYSSIERCIESPEDGKSPVQVLELNIM